MHEYNLAASPSPTWIFRTILTLLKPGKNILKNICHSGAY
jgi:hypothetical protein